MPKNNESFARPENKIAPETSPSDLLSAKRKEQLQKALKTDEGIAGLKSWRAIDREGAGARTTRRLFDRLSAFDLARKESPQALEKLSGSLDVAPAGGGRLAELQSLILADKSGAPLPDVRPEVLKIFDGLRRAASTEGEMNAIDLLGSGNVSFGDKQKWFEAQVLPAIKFLEKRDLLEARKKAQTPPSADVLEQKEQAPEINLPPQEQDELAPSMDEMQKSKEGEPGAYFTIAPFWGGYYREGHYSNWNKQDLKWERAERKWYDAEQIAIEEKSRRVVYGTARGSGVTPLPMPYGFAPDAATLKLLSGGKAKIVAEEGGGFAIETEGKKPVSFSVEIGRGRVAGDRTFAEKIKIEPGKFLTKTENKILEIAKLKGTALEKARMLKSHVRQLLTYSNESGMNAVHRNGDPAGYFSRIEEYKKADCDVANTFFVALLSRLDIQARLVHGHYVNSKDKTGSAVISSGTGHAWSEVYDNNEWHRLDATPPGDPDMDDEETDEKSDEEIGEGDFGEQEAEEISDEELAKMMKKAEESLKEKKQTPQEKKELTFAEQAGCSAEEARKILARIEAARGLRDRQGRLIHSRLIAEFQKIVRENSVERLRYKAPVRMSEGRDLADPVEAVLDLKAGEADPTGFAKYEKKIKREQIYGGFDVVFLTDKSGSMAETDPASGQPKWHDQQKFVFLFLDALSAAKDEFKRNKIKLISPMDVRTALISFNAGGAIVELPLSENWGPKEQYAVWKSLQSNVGGGTPDHLGLAAAQSMIEADQKTLKKAGKNRLRLVLVSADGGSDNSAKTLSAKEKLKESAIVKAAGIGAGARAVEAAYFPDGVNLADFSQAPDWAAEHVIKTARELYPRKIKK
ncbi:MAG: transglutaminase domain-containing protein [Parcubacteria group bacterium]